MADEKDDESRLWAAVATLLLLRNRRDQEEVARRLGLDLARLWPLLSFDDLDGTADAWVDSAVGFTARAFDDSAREAVDFHNNYMVARALQDSDLVPAPVETVVSPPHVNELSVRQKLLLTSVGTVKHAMPAPEKPTMLKALKATVGAAQTEALQGGREFTKSVSEMGVVTGWQRMTDGDPCAFCALLAAKGPVYQNLGRIARTDAKYLGDQQVPEDSAKVHWHCKCTLVPVYKDRPEPLTGWARVAYELWDQMGSAEAMLSWRDKRRLFRRRYDNLMESDPDSGVESDVADLRRQVNAALRSPKYRDERIRAALIAAARD